MKTRATRQSRTSVRWLFLAAAVLASLLPARGAFAAGEWPQFRGPRGDGHSDATDLPLTWSETTNVKWKTAIPGQGWSSPVVWGEQIWLTTALDQGKSLRAIQVNRESGRIERDIELFAPADPGSIHALNSYASPTPVIDADRVYCHFGNFGIAAVSTKTGEIAWKNQEFDLTYTVGPGSSPILYGDLYIVHCDGINGRFIAALDKATGRVKWKSDRTNPIKKTVQQEKSFSTPLLVRQGGQDQLISIHADAVTAYEPKTGKEIWQARYDGYSNVAAPVASEDMVFINTGYDVAQFWAVRLGGRGDVTRSHVAWKQTRGIGKRVSPLLVDGAIYLMSDEGVATCYDAATGRLTWQQRVGGQFSASPVYADGRIYYFDQAGVTTVIAPGGQYKQLARNELGDGFMASPAIAGKAFILRSKSALYRVEQ
jgi:outer membrane protein assembly factor BamB